MKQLTVLSGKGGTGKTTLTSSFAFLSAGRIVILDADVDAANLYIVLEHKIEKEEEIEDGKVARIEREKCTGCGLCFQHCQFDAIVEEPDGKFRIDEPKCEGCGVCEFVCPENAVSLHFSPIGKLYKSSTPFGPFRHARLYPGGESSGRVVTLLRERAEDSAVEEKKDLILIDGPPGIGCPANAAITGVNLVLVVAEPTVAGWHDMIRALQLTSFFRIPTMVCVNRYDINPEMTQEIENYCREQGVKFVGRIPYDRRVIEAQLMGKPVVEAFPQSRSALAIKSIWETVISTLELN